MNIEEATAIVCADVDYWVECRRLMREAVARGESTFGTCTKITKERFRQLMGRDLTNDEARKRYDLWWQFWAEMDKDLERP